MDYRTLGTSGLKVSTLGLGAISLVVRDLEREHVPLCRRFGVGLIPWSPLAGGSLSAKYHKGQIPPSGSRLDTWKEPYLGWIRLRPPPRPKRPTCSPGFPWSARDRSWYQRSRRSVDRMSRSPQPAVGSFA